MKKVNLLLEDITKIRADIIVNAANTSLLGGSGVDGAIHRVGGKQILDECRKIRSAHGSCKIGESVITLAGNLPANYVIHTVGPKWNGGYSDEENKLKNCYESCLDLFLSKGMKTISFPNISTGIYGFPKIKAAKIALRVISCYINKYSEIEKVNIVCFEKENFSVYESII